MTIHTISEEVITSFRNQLEQHPIYQAVATIDDLRCFMQHHVYSVWDFMSLIKSLQAIVAPAQAPWIPQGDGSIRRFINELVLEEESDQTHREGEYSSHFELYHQAMQEIGADTTQSSAFLDRLRQDGIDAALNSPFIPLPAKHFSSTTFSFIQSQKPHQVAAALALGREHIIPAMFRAILKQIGVSAQQAPIFHFYLKRHIHLDEDFHAPLSLRLLNALCDNDHNKISEAIAAAELAVQARIKFWDEVLEVIEK